MIYLQILKVSFFYYHFLQSEVGDDIVFVSLLSKSEKKNPENF